MQNQYNTRIEYVDLSKGICMLLVMIGHFGLLSESWKIADLTNTLTILRMPLYYTLSGLFFKTYNDFSFFLKKKINHLLIPYILFISLDYMTPFQFDSVWFLFSLFVVNLIGYCVIHCYNTLLSKKNKNAILLLSLIVFVIPIVGFYFEFPVFGGIKRRILIYHLNWILSSLVAFPFFIGGYLLKNKTKYLSKKNWNDGLLIFGGVISVCMCATIFPGKYASYWAHSFQIPLALIYLWGAICTLGVLSISKFLSHIPVVSYIGRYSIIVLITHKVIIGASISFCNRYFPIMLNSKWFLLLLFFVIVLLEVPVIYISKRFFPHVFAQKDVLK